MATGHRHAAPGVDLDLGGPTRRWLVAVTVALAVLTALGALILRPTGDDRPDLGRFGITSEVFDGEVVGVEEGPCSGTRVEDAVLCDRVSVEMHEGPDAGEIVEFELALGGANPELDRGDEIVLTRSQGEEGAAYQFADRQRRGVLLGLAALFALAVVVLGRLRGFTALGGLAASLAVLLWFALPAIIDGRPPVAVAVVAAAIVAFLALYLAHGFTSMTTVALLGTLASLALTAILAAVFVWLARFSGLATEEAFYLQLAGDRIDLQGLLLAGVVIGALGAIDDMTVTQASAVWELRAANPTLGLGALYTAGVRIGRDHVASTVNTLVLAYAGASLPLLLLFVLSEQSLGTVANSELVAIEIVRTLVGSIGLVAAVPLTTWLAARVAVVSRPRVPAAPPEGAEPASPDPSDRRPDD